MQQITFDLILRPQRIKNLVDAPLLPDEMSRAQEARRQHKRALARDWEARQARKRQVQHVY